MDNSKIATKEKSYFYRKHLRESFLFYLKLELVFMVIVMLPMIASIVQIEDSSWLIGGTLLLYILIILLIFSVIVIVPVYYLFIRKFRYIKVTLKEDKIIYKNRKEEKVIPYDEITKISFPSVKYAGGWIKIKYNGGNVRLTVVVENIGDFLYELKLKLDTIDKTDVYDEDKYRNFFKTAVFSDESWARLYDNIKFIFINLLLNIVVVFILTSLFKFNYEGTIVMPLDISIIAIGVGFVVAEIIIGTKVKKRVVDKELKITDRNVEWENKVMRRAIVISSILGILASAIISIL